MDRIDESLREIARIEKDIEELLEYRATLFDRGRTITGWAGFVGGLKLRLDCRQIQRHLQYLRLKLDVARHAHENLQKTRGRPV